MTPDPARALAWRLRRHALDPAAATTASDVARRVVALRGWPVDAADLAVCVRQATPESGELERALDAGELVQSYAFRGGAYVFTPDNAALVLSARTATRVWETRRWQQQGGFELGDWEPWREELCSILADGPMTRDEISARLVETGLSHLAAAATGAGADCLYKPLHWWGDICFGPRRDGKSTFRLLRGDPQWPGLPVIDDAGPELIVRYVHAYGPVMHENLSYWLTAGLGVPGRRVRDWLTSLEDELTTVSFDGKEALVLRDDVEGLLTAEPSQAVRLLPAFDPWILGPGTADVRLISPGRRDVFSRGASPVVQRGVVAGTWRLQGNRAAVSWFGEGDDASWNALDEDVQRLSGILGRTLSVDVSTI